MLAVGIFTQEDTISKVSNLNEITSGKVYFEHKNKTNKNSKDFTPKQPENGTTNIVMYDNFIKDHNLDWI